MKKSIWILLIIVLLLFAFIFAFKLLGDKPTFENMSKVNVYLDGILDSEYRHKAVDNNIYISAEYLMDKKLLDYYWDLEYNKISIFNDFNYLVLNYNSKKAFYDEVTYDKGDVLYIEEDKLYFNSLFIKDKYVEKLYVDTLNSNVIIEENVKQYKINKKTKLKKIPDGRSDTIADLEEADTIYVYESQVGDWILSRTEGGSIGYIKLANIDPVSKEVYEKYFSYNKGREISLAWDLIYSTIKEFKPFDIPNAVDIVAPTWYDLTEEEGYFIDISNDEYIEYVKSCGKEIWGVFNNNFDPDLTDKLLNDGIKRSEIVNRIIEITKEKGYDGINIDFENMYMGNKDVFSAFIKELYCKTKAENILMTVDITILSNSEMWSLCFDRDVIGKYSDYVMLMAYDENVSGTPGSVSSLPWVEYGVKNLLESAPSSKIVLGMPFYTRLWEQQDGKTKSTALRIQSAQELLEKLEIELDYDQSTGQNYGEKIIDGVRCIIWNEDETSIKSRIDIADKYKLAGKAVWALDYGTEEIWRLME